MSTTTARRSSASVSALERQILVRVDRGVQISEAELRYQLERKDAHPLAREEDLLDVLADLESRGLIERKLHFRLTASGQVQLRS